MSLHICEFIHGEGVKVAKSLMLTFAIPTSERMESL